MHARPQAWPRLPGDGPFACLTRRVASHLPYKVRQMRSDPGMWLWCGDAAGLLPRSYPILVRRGTHAYQATDVTGPARGTAPDGVRCRWEARRRVQGPADHHSRLNASQPMGTWSAGQGVCLCVASDPAPDPQSITGGPATIPIGHKGDRGAKCASSSGAAQAHEEISAPSRWSVFPYFGESFGSERPGTLPNLLLLKTLLVKEFEGVECFLRRCGSEWFSALRSWSLCGRCV
jgi:hypothetical protein